MRSLLVFLLSVTFLASAALQAKELPKASSSALDLTLARDLYLLDSFRANPTPENAARLKAFNLTAKPDPVLAVFLHFAKTPDDKTLTALEKDGIKVFRFCWTPPAGAHKTGFLPARIKASLVRSLLKRGDVVRITAAYRKLQIQNDLTAEETGAAEAWTQNPPLTGSGVRIGVLDSGFQLDHPDLPAPTLAIDYADYPDTSNDVTDRCNAHGTHVAGTVFGSGLLSGGRYKGMAPDAEPVYFKIGNDSTAEASTEAVVAAVRAAAFLGHCDVATMSYGGSDGFNDGSSAEEQATDWAVSQGVTFFMSAGNSTQKAYHYYGSVAPGESSEPIEVFSRSAPENEYWSLQSAYYDGPDTSLHVMLTVMVNDANGNPVPGFDEAQWVNTPRGTEGMVLSSAEPLPREAVSYFVQVVNFSEEVQDFHLNLSSPNQRIRFRQPAEGYLALAPSTADGCISVGAFTSRTSWTDYTGQFYDDGTTRGELAAFSAVGPRIDGVLKPDITAPGQKIISCRNQDIVRMDGMLQALIISNEGDSGEPADYLALQGTSMSSPAAAGTAALIKQHFPAYSPDELRRNITLSARRDGFTGQTPNIRWGHGKIDVIEALSIPNARGDKPLPRQVVIENVYPNPFNSELTVEYRDVGSGEVEIALFDAAGRKIKEAARAAAGGSELQRITVDLKGVPSGGYFVRVSQNQQADFRKIDLTR